MGLAVPLPPRVERAIGGSGPAREAAVDEAVHLLQGPDSEWPVDTGRSKRAWRRIGRGNRATLYNPVSYAAPVEARNGRPARRTLAKHAGRLAAVAQAARQTGVGGAAATERTLEHLERILRAYAARGRYEEAAGVLDLYMAELARQGRRSPRIPKHLRLLDRKIRRRAAHAPAVG